MSILNNIFGSIGNKINGTIFYTQRATLLDNSPTFSKIDESRKLLAVISNPAFLKVVALQCDLFSLARVTLTSGDQEIKQDPLIRLLKRPNFFQTQRQFLWDYMFWTMLGGSILYIKKSINEDKNIMYWLDPSRLEFPEELNKYKGAPITDKAIYTTIQKTKVLYDKGNGTKMTLLLKDLIFMTDLSNGMGNWFKGHSRVDALYKIIGNSEEALNSKNINISFLAKFLVSGKIREGDLTAPMMQGKERKEIEQKLLNNKNLHINTTPTDIKRFIEQSGVLESLDKSYLEDYYKIGKMYGIRKDILEAYQKGSTYENQEKAIGAQISYTLQPKANDLAEAIINSFDYNDKELNFDYNYLPFMQVFERDKSEAQNFKAEALERLIRSGAKPETAIMELGYKILEIDENRINNQ